MPQLVAPPYNQLVELDAPWSPFKFEGQSISREYAARLVDDTLFRWEMWRMQNCDPRWRLNEWLYYGYVPPRVWDGTSIPRSSIPWQIAFDQVEAASVKLFRELLATDEIIGVFPEGQTHPLEAAQIRDRLLYILDHNINDLGWTARMELELCLKDMLIYGNCFGMVEFDHERDQSTVFRVDPRDVFFDPSCASPLVDKARAAIVRRPVSIDDVNSMRGFRSFAIPPAPVLNWLAKNREYSVGDRSKSTQEAARGVRYQPIADDYIPNPSAQWIDLYIYMGGGREIWQLGRGANQAAIIYNEPYPYGCSRLLSAPCFTVPNRFYAQSYVDVLDPLQQLGTALINRHLDEITLALNPPRATKQGAIRTPSSMAWRPGLINEFANPKDDQVVYQQQGVTQQVWQTLAWCKAEAEARTGQSSLATGGTPTPSNANRTRGGMQMQLQAPMERLSAIASNFEQYFLVPMCYKLLKIEKVHASKERKIYGRRTAAFVGPVTGPAPSPLAAAAGAGGLGGLGSALGL